MMSPVLSDPARVQRMEEERKLCRDGSKIRGDQGEKMLIFCGQILIPGWVSLQRGGLVASDLQSPTSGWMF